MYNVYFQNFNKRIQLSESEQALISGHLTFRKLRKKHFLLLEGEVCRTIAFVEKGALRSYTVNDKGVEHVTQFAMEGWFISDLYSFLTGEPSDLFIEAIESAEVVLINKAAHEDLLRKCPKYETFTRELITDAYVALQKRLHAINSASPEEKYAFFLKQYPQIAARVPQHMIASYMGLTPETLSRIRRRMAGNG